MTKTKGLLLIGLLVLSVTVGCTTLEKKNIEIVQHGYELFGQGDIPGFLAQLSVVCKRGGHGLFPRRLLFLIRLQLR